MNLSYEWKDFIVFPLDPDRVLTRDARFDLSLTSAGAKAVSKEMVVRPGDEFEAIRVDEVGNVSIWTKNLAWTLLRDHGTERLTSIPRYPHEERYLGRS